MNTDEYNFTDPESRIMKGPDGLVQAHNAQIAAEPDFQLIVGQSVTGAFIDKQQLRVSFRNLQFYVGVAIVIAHNPFHGSGPAAFPHPALALGDDAHVPQGIGMTNSRHGQPASHDAPHAIPKDAAVLIPPRQRAMPKPADSEPKNHRRLLVAGHSVVPNVSAHHRRLQPLALFGDGFMHSSLELGFHFIPLCLPPFAYRLPQHGKPSIAPLLHADMRKAARTSGL
jgi:hypothetical protein